MTTATRTHTSRLVQARKALSQAQANVAPLDAETEALVRARVTPERWDKVQAEVAAIVATIPALAAEVAELEARSCTRCAGTGDYNAPTGHLVRGRPVCFGCGGSGLR